MAKWMVVAVTCFLGVAGACSDDAAKPADGGVNLDGGGQGGAPGTPEAGAPDVAGTGGATGTGGTTSAGTGGTTPAGTGGTVADAGTPDTSPAASMMITAAGGGTLTSGGASLVIPPGGLAGDKILTVAVRAPADEPGRTNIVGDIYEFGPDGTTFTVPVALTLPLPMAVPAEKKVVMAWLDVPSGQWFPVPSTVTGDKVTGMVSHFTRFSLLVLPKEETCPYGGACGGSLEGTWKYTQSCLKAEEKDAFMCGTAGIVKMRTEYYIAGTVTFAGGAFTANQMITVNGTLLYTPACMAYLKESMADLDCAKLQAAWRTQNVQPGMPEHPWICAGSVALGCSCQLTQMASQNVTGTAEVNGNKVTFTQTGKPAGSPDEFCVQGTNLSVKTAKGDVYTAVKQ